MLIKMRGPDFSSMIASSASEGCDDAQFLRIVGVNHGSANKACASRPTITTYKFDFAAS